METATTLLNARSFDNTIYIKQEPYVGEDGIYVPCEPYAPEGMVSAYKCIITKELFVEAYNKWIKEGE